MKSAGLFFIALFASGALGVVDDATRKIVQDALFEALTRMESLTEQSVSSGSIIDSQIASEDSKKLQYNAKVLELASQILVDKYGLRILEDANEVLQEMKGGEDVKNSESQ